MDASSIGPAQRRYAATVNSARHTGELEAPDALRDAMAEAQRSAIDVHLRAAMAGSPASPD